MNRIEANFLPLTQMWDYPNLNQPGLYLIGQSVANSDTKRISYLIKIGYSKNVTQRLKQYFTYNPHVSIIDTIPFNKKEKDYFGIEACFHIDLDNIGIRCGFSEWYQVSEENYNLINTNKFEFFNAIKVFRDSFEE